MVTVPTNVFISFNCLVDDFIRREHSTTLQLVRVITHLSDATNRRAATAAALLDVSKAFDKVWHEGLLFKLANSPLPSTIVFFLRSYISDRTFRVSVDGSCSTV